MKILIVDDDKEIVELLSIYVKNEGYEPIQAYSGKEAITKLVTNPDIALMILDIMMPNMSGMDVVKEVRKDSQIPIIIVSAGQDSRPYYWSRRLCHQAIQSARGHGARQKFVAPKSK